MKIYFYTLALLLFSSFVFGQNIPTQLPIYPGKSVKDEGYVITNNNDTIFGMVELWKDDCFIKVCLTNKMANKGTFYRADKIKKFKIGKSFYESIVLKDAHYFFRRLIDGPVSLFDQYDVQKQNFASGNIDFGSTKRTKKEYYLLKNDYLVKVPHTFFKKNMAEYFKDDEKLSKEIENNELGFENLVAIISEYNEWYISKK